MRHLSTLTRAIVVGILSTAAFLCISSAAAQTSQPAAVYQSFLPLVVGPSSSQSPAEQTIASQVLALVNQERSAAGCAALRLNPLLNDAAQGHSEDMARNNYFSHTALDGTTASQRVTRTGYAWSRTGENIAAGYTTPAEVMHGWMNSPGHRANLLTCDYTEIGIGYYYEPDDTYPGPYGYDYYWTQVFATP